MTGAFTVIVRDDRTGRDTDLRTSPVSHSEACAHARKLSPRRHPWQRVMVCPVAEVRDLTGCRAVRL